VFIKSIGDMLRSFFHLALPARAEGSKKDSTVWLNGAGPPQISIIMSSTNSKFDKLRQKKFRPT